MTPKEAAAYCIYLRQYLTYGFDTNNKACAHIQQRLCDKNFTQDLEVTYRKSYSLFKEMKGLNKLSLNKLTTHSCFSGPPIPGPRDWPPC